MYVVLCLIVSGCQYQCNWLPGKTCLRNDLLCVKWDVKPYTLTHSLNTVYDEGLCAVDQSNVTKNVGFSVENLQLIQYNSNCFVQHIITGMRPGYISMTY